MSKSIKWTVKHQEEATRCIYELAGEVVVNGYALDAHQLAARAQSVGRNEASFLERFADGTVHGKTLGRRYLRRVDGLATGRLIRVETWHVRNTATGETSAALDEMKVRMLVDQRPGSVVVRRISVRKVLARMP